MKKIFLCILAGLMFMPTVCAKVLKNDFTTVISDSMIPKNSISVCIKNIENQKVIYELNSMILNHPASVQKLLTLPAAIDILGEDYRYTTELYKRNGDNYIIKLGADPYFTTDNLDSIIEKIDPHNVKKIDIDDSIIEPKDWGEGWQWDDNLNVLMPKFNSYNIDKNLIDLTVMPTTKGEKPLIINPSGYPIVFFNNIITADKNNIIVKRDSSISENTLTLSGTVSSSTTITIPISNLKRYYNVQLTKALEDKNIYLKTSRDSAYVSKNDIKICKISHPITTAIDDVLKDSNNMVMETTMKLAGAKAYNTQGTDSAGLMLFDDYCKKIGIDPYKIRIVDASGVSKNNLVNAEFITDYLIKSKDNKTLQHLARPGEGTLSTRMLPLKENLRAKTGTLADISSIAGYITTKKGKNYAFCIIISDPKSSSAEKKALEDYLIRAMYLN